MALFLLGLSLFAGFRYIGPKTDFGRQKAVSAAMSSTVQKALWAYAARNFRLPCPADGSFSDTTSASYGQESCGLANLGAGIVPWKTLGLRPQAAQDAWGNWIGYAVSTSLTSKAAKLYQNTPPAKFVGKDAVTVSGTAYAYVLMSFGPNGGSYNLKGNQIPVNSGASKLTDLELTGEDTNRRAMATGTNFVSAAAPGATGAQWLTYESSAQICLDLNGTSGSGPYCGNSTNPSTDGTTPAPGGVAPMNPMGTTSGISMTSSSQTSNPNGVSSGAVLVSGSSGEVLVLGTSSTTPSITSAPSLLNSSQACSWFTNPMLFTTQTLRGYFLFSTVGATAGDGFTFTLLPASTIVSATYTPCGGTPGGQGTSGGAGNTNEGSYLGFEAIVDGGASGSAAVNTVGVTGGAVSSFTMAAKGAGYQWAPPVEIRGAGTGATAFAQMTVNSIMVTGRGLGYMAAAAGGDPRPAVTVATGGGAGYLSAPTVVVETAAATGCTAGCSDAAATAVLSNGVITALQLTSRGSGYQRSPAVTLTGAADSGCTVGCADAIGASATIDGATGMVSGFFITTDSCVNPCIPATAEVNSMAVTGASLITGGSGYFLASGGIGYSSTPSVLIFNNNSGLTSAGQGAAGTATMSGSTVTGLALTSGGSGYGGASVAVAGGGIGYFTIAGVNNGAVSALSLADNGHVSANAGTYTEHNSVIAFSLPSPVHCSSSCAAALVAASISTQGLITDYTIVYGGSGYDATYDVGNYAPVYDSQHQPALAQITVSGGAVNGLTIPAANIPLAPSVTVLADAGDPNIANIVPANISANVNQSGQVTSLVVNTIGSGYQRVPSISIGAPATCGNPSTCNATASVISMSVLGIQVDSSAQTFTALPSIGIAPPDPRYCPLFYCYAATGAANTSISGITVNNGGSGYAQASTTVTLPPPLIMPKLGVEFRTYHHPTDPFFSNYGYHDDWGFFGSNTGATYGTGASINAALTSPTTTQTAGDYATLTGITMPQANISTRGFGGNIRHDDTAACDGDGCNPQYMAALLVDSIQHDDTYHYSTTTTSNGAYTVSSACDSSSGIPAQHDGGFISGGPGNSGALANFSAPTANGCTYDAANNTKILTNNGPYIDNEGGTNVFYHSVRLEVQRYCDPTCSSCGNTTTPGASYIHVAAYLDCDSTTLGGASCSDMSQNLLLPGTRVMYVKVTNGGSGYATIPSVTIQPIPGDTGRGATAIATISGGSVTGVTIVTNGSYYYQVPSVSFTGGGGHGATATASLSGFPMVATNPNAYALNYCTVDPGATNWTSSQRGLKSLDSIIAGFTIGAGAATRGALIQRALAETYN